jgi:hypothetical protein
MRGAKPAAGSSSCARSSRRSWPQASTSAQVACSASDDMAGRVRVRRRGQRRSGQRIGARGMDADLVSVADISCGRTAASRVLSSHHGLACVVLVLAPAPILACSRALSHSRAAHVVHVI